MSKQIKLMLGDNIESLKKLPDNSIHSVVSDPPYGLSFMNKKWDYNVPSVELWKEVYRVLKPGGHVLSFGGTRTYHRMVVNLEDAGFEIRDCITWQYGQGFPKSLNIGKAVDKLQGNKREVVGKLKNYQDKRGLNGQANVMENAKPRIDIDIDRGTSDQEGWGTALKPSVELICMARKPLSENTIAENVLKWGTGGINVDECRIGSEGGTMKVDINQESNTLFEGGRHNSGKVQNLNEGRFPANSIWDEEAAKMLDEQSGLVNQGHWPKGSTKGYGEFGGGTTSYEGVGPKDKTKSGASRFFYVAKVSKKERNMGLEDKTSKAAAEEKLHSGQDNGMKNNHPTLKPVQLMAYLCRLVTPPNGIVLDPFMGSGSTGISALLEGFRFCGMELDEQYFKIAEARINNYELYREFVEKKIKLKNGNKRMASRNSDSNSLGLGICKKKEK